MTPGTLVTVVEGAYRGRLGRVLTDSGGTLVISLAPTGAKASFGAFEVTRTVGGQRIAAPRKP